MKNINYIFSCLLLILPQLGFSQDGDLKTFYRLCDMADFFELSGNIEKCVEYKKKMIDYSTTISNDSFPLIYSLFSLATILDGQDSEEYEREAVVYYKKALELQVLQQDTSYISSSLSTMKAIVVIYHTLNEYNNVINSIKEYENYFSSIDSVKYKKDILDILYWKASSYQRLNFYIKGSRDEAIIIQKERIKYWGKLYGYENPKFLEELYLLTFYLSDENKELIEDIYEYAFSLLIKSPDKYEKIYPLYLNNYLTFLYTGNEFDSERVKRVEEEMEKICSLPTTSFNTRINYYYTQSKIQTNRLNYLLADSLCNKGLEICEENDIDFFPTETYAELLAQKSIIQYWIGNIDHADSFANKAYATIAKLDNKNFVTADILSSLSYLKADLGDNDEAQMLREMSLSIQEQCDPQHIDPYALIHLLSFKKGQDLITTFHKYTDNNLYLRQHPAYGCILPYLGTAYTYLGECHIADSIFEEAETLLKTNKSHSSYTEGDSARYFDALESLYKFSGLNSFKQGDFVECLHFFEKAYLYSKEPHFLSALSLLYAITNDSVKFEESIKATLDFEVSQIREKFCFLSEHEQEIFMKNQLDISLALIEVAPSLIYSSKIVQSAYNAVLIHKGMLLSSYVGVKRQLSSNDSLMDVHTAELQRLKSDYSIAGDALKREEVSDSIRTIEKYIQRHVSQNTQYLDDLIVTWEQVKKNLNEKEVVIEFVQQSSWEDFILYGGEDSESIKYGALVLTYNDSLPLFVPLCSKKDLLDIDNLYKENNINQAAKLIWGPLSDVIKKAETIYFSPIDYLHTINLEVLANSIFPEKSFIRLSSSRILCKQSSNTLVKTAVLYGDLDYNYEITNNKSLIITDAISYLRHTNHMGYKIPRLEYTSKEVVSINHLMNENGINSHIYQGGNGTEESYKLLNNKIISILHLATHGFSTGVNAIVDYDEPMRKCGLLLSKSQKAWEKKPIPQGMEDGILLGEEIVNVNLQENDLVVLSACETGLGKISSEGVWGLQRAFKKAGAKSVLMSLWNVDDYSTQLLMTEFYRHYLSGTSKHESLKIAQRHVREYEDEEGNRLFEDPLYWAGFILLDALD